MVKQCLAIAQHDRMKDEMLRFAQHDRMEGHDRMEDVAPSGSEGSLGAYVPRDDKKGSVPRQDKVGRCLATLGMTGKRTLGRTKWRGMPSREKCLMGRRPERSEGCLAKGLKILWKMLILIDRKADFSKKERFGVCKRGMRSTPLRIC